MHHSKTHAYTSHSPLLYLTSLRMAKLRDSPKLFWKKFSNIECHFSIKAE